MKPRYLAKALSYRVARRREHLSLAEHLLRFLIAQVTESCGGMGSLRLALAGMLNGGLAKGMKKQ